MWVTYTKKIEYCVVLYNDSMDEDQPIHFLSKSRTKSAKFNLFLKAREMRQVEKVLEQILILPEQSRRRWVEENGEMMSAAFESFIEDSNQTLEEMNLDLESLELSKELVTALRDTTNIVQGILSEKQKLTG